MKIFLSTFLALLLFACSNTKEETSKSLLPDEEKRRIFYAIADTTKNARVIRLKRFYDFYKEYYPNNIGAYANYKDAAAIYYSLNEELINPESHKIDCSRQWMRCLIMHPFDNFPKLISLEKKGEHYLLKTKVDSTIFNLDYNFRFSGEESSREIDANMAIGVFHYIKSLGILSDTTKYGRASVLDGSSYYFESIIDGEYIKINLFDGYIALERRNPESKNRFLFMMKICNALYDSSAIGKREIFEREEYCKLHPDECP